jgi:hypothetical protein
MRRASDVCDASNTSESSADFADVGIYYPGNSRTVDRSHGEFPAAAPRLAGPAAPGPPTKSAAGLSCAASRPVRRRFGLQPARSCSPAARRPVRPPQPEPPRGVRCAGSWWARTRPAATSWWRLAPGTPPSTPTSSTHVRPAAESGEGAVGSGRVHLAITAHTAPRPNPLPGHKNRCAELEAINRSV